MIMVLAIDRYLVVSFPLKSHSWCTPEKARVVTVLVLVVSALFNSPRWPYFYYRIIQSTKNDDGDLFISHQEGNILAFDEDLYRKIYHISLSLIFLSLWGPEERTCSSKGLTFNRATANEL